MLLLYIIHKIFLPHDAIYFVKCTSPSCSKAPPKHYAATPVHHCWDGILRLASLRLFPPNITMVIMAKQFYFCFIRPEYNSSKIRYMSPCAVANCSLAFLWQFWSSGFFLAEQPFQVMSRRQNVSPSWAVWHLRGPMVFVLAYYCLYRWMWYLQEFGNCSQGWTRLVEVYNFV